MNLVKQKALKSNIFSMYMSRGGKKDSELCIGCVDSAKFSGKIDYYPLNPKATKNIQYYWNIKVRRGFMSRAYNTQVTAMSDLF